MTIGYHYFALIQLYAKISEIVYMPSKSKSCFRWNIFRNGLFISEQKSSGVKRMKVADIEFGISFGVISQASVHVCFQVRTVEVLLADWHVGRFANKMKTANCKWCAADVSVYCNIWLYVLKQSFSLGTDVTHFVQCTNEKKAVQRKN